MNYQKFFAHKRLMGGSKDSAVRVLQGRQFDMTKNFHDGADRDASNLGRGTVSCPGQGESLESHRGLKELCHTSHAVKLSCPERVGACVHS